MYSGDYYKLMSYPKDILVKFMLETIEEIDYKKIDSMGWERTSGKINNQMESLKTSLEKVKEKGFDAKSKEFLRVQRKLKQKEMMLKWISKKKNQAFAD